MLKQEDLRVGDQVYFDTDISTEVGIVLEVHVDYIVAKDTYGDIFSFSYKDVSIIPADLISCDCQQVGI